MLAYQGCFGKEAVKRVLCRLILVVMFPNLYDVMYNSSKLFAADAATGWKLDIKLVVCACIVDYVK